MNNIKYTDMRLNLWKFPEIQRHVILSHNFCFNFQFTTTDKKMQKFAALLAFCAAFQQIHSLPVITQPTTTTAAPKPEEPDSPMENLENIIEYERYLKEVVNALESDPQFREKLNNAQENDIRTGKIAQELEYVNHHVRNKLDELKRQELQRLKELARREYELSNNIDRDHMKIVEHLDHENQHTFEIEDLRKLILKTWPKLIDEGVKSLNSTNCKRNLRSRNN